MASNMMKSDSIRGLESTRQVWIGDKELLPDRSLKLWNHSPTGFAWGYEGSGPSQLALAIMLELTDSEELAFELYQDFKRAFVSHWEGNFYCTVQEVNTWLIERQLGPLGFVRFNEIDIT